ncbi:hypothetical protein BH10ACT7_BH10ACT7_21640 [soil metagenome]
MGGSYPMPIPGGRMPLLLHLVEWQRAPPGGPKRPAGVLRIAVMGNTASATAEAVAATTPKQAWDISAPIDPTRFYPKFGPLPAVVQVRDQSGPWDTPGRTRTLVLSDGGSVVETITDAKSPSYFAYDLSDFTKLFGVLVADARAEWTFERIAEGTKITWTYRFRGLPGRAWIVKLIVSLWWARYMKRVLPPIAREVERAAAHPAPQSPQR